METDGVATDGGWPPPVRCRIAPGCRPDEPARLLGHEPAVGAGAVRDGVAPEPEPMPGARRRMHKTGWVRDRCRGSVADRSTRWSALLGSMWPRRSWSWPSMAVPDARAGRMTRRV